MKHCKGTALMAIVLVGIMVLLPSLAAAPPPPVIVINEILADPASGLAGDANGDGVINLDDTLAVTENFAFSHYYTPDKEKSAYDIYVEWDTTYDAKATAGKAKARMARPTKDKPAVDIYAFGFEIEVVGGEGLIWNTVRVNYNGEWFGDFGDNAYGFSVVDSVKQMIYIAMTRLDYENASDIGITNLNFKSYIREIIEKYFNGDDRKEIYELWNKSGFLEKVEKLGFFNE